MNKSIFAIITLAASISALSAQEYRIDSTVVLSPDQVLLTQQADTLSIEIQGQKDAPGFLYKRTVVLDNPSETLISQSNKTTTTHSWNAIETRIKNRGNFFSGFAGNVDFGFLFFPNKPSSMGSTNWKSFEVALNIGRMAYQPFNSRFTYSLDFGVNYRHIEMDGPNRFVGEKNGSLSISHYPEGSKPICTMIDRFTPSLSLNVHYQYSKAGVIGFGIEQSGYKGNRLAIARSMYWDADGSKIVDVQHINKMRAFYPGFKFSWMGQSGKEAVGIFVKYHPWSMFQKGQGLNSSCISAGFTIRF